MKPIAAGRMGLLAVGMVMAAVCAGGSRNTPLDRTMAFDRARALMAEDFAKASGSLKVAIAEYYQSMGKMPESNAQAGVPAPSEYRGRTLRSATIGEGGVIELVFDANSGMAGGRIRLLPDVAHANAMGVQWRCVSSDYPQVRRINPTCDFIGR